MLLNFAYKGNGPRRKIQSQAKHTVLAHAHDLPIGIPGKFLQDRDLVGGRGRRASHILPLTQGESVDGIYCFYEKCSVRREMLDLNFSRLESPW